jgi:hypothetical protein
MPQLPELTVLACDDTVPAVAADTLALDAVVEALVVLVVLVEPAVADVVAVWPLDELAAVVLELPAVAARPPVSATIAATLPAPTMRRERRAGCGRFLRAGLLMKPMMRPVTQNSL